MQTKVDVSKYVVNVQGKDFITFPGLLAEAHAQGLASIETELVNEDLTNPIMKAVVTIDGKRFTGYGDANAQNVAKKVAGALIRMAETRAVARALRFACNIDMTALEELDVEDHGKTAAPKTPSKVEVKETGNKVEVPKVKLTVPTISAPAVSAPAVKTSSLPSKRKVSNSEPNFP